MSMNNPYTYLIGWSKHHKYYFGVRYANKEEAKNDLWVRYFTSSEYVKKLRNELGEPDIREIWEHQTKEEAIETEKRFLQRQMEREDADEWLNANVAGVFICKPETRQKMTETRKRLFQESQELQEILKVNWGKPHSDESKKKISRALTGIKRGKQSQEHINKRMAKRRMKTHLQNSLNR